MRQTRKTVAACTSLMLAMLSVAGCMRPRETEDERLRRQAAEGTKQLREDARSAAVVARQEAQKAGQQAKDIVEGVKEGWQEGAAPGTGNGHPLDLNHATAGQLSALPGVSARTADRIVRKRPYASTEDLVTRGILTEAQYDRIEDRVVVHK